MERKRNLCFKSIAMLIVVLIGLSGISLSASAAYGSGGFVYQPPSGSSVRDNFELSYGATIDTQYANVIILTPDVLHKYGTAWAKQKVDLSQSFSLEAYLHLGHRSGKSGYTADGITFTLQNDYRGLTALTSDLNGESLGVHGSGYLQKALSIEFDSYPNTLNTNSGLNICTDPQYGSYGHTGFILPAAKVYTNSHLQYSYFQVTQNWVALSVKWTPSGSGNNLGGTLEYTFGGLAAKRYQVSNVNTTFGSRNVYWGFTGATGNISELNAVAMKKMPVQKTTNTITYLPNGGVGNQVNDVVNTNTNYTIRGNDTTNFTRNNYAFAGWNTKADGSGQSYPPGSTYYVTGDLTLYAQWTQELRYIIYEPNGGTGGYVYEGAALYSNYTIRGNDYTGFSRPGYTFVGWNTLPNGNGQSYPPGSIYHVTDNLVLYAQWEPDTRYIIYQPNGGTGDPLIDTAMLNSNYTILGNNTTGFTRPGYTFDGWNTSANGNGQSYPPGSVYNVTDNLVLYAQWKTEEIRYIIYLPNGGTGNTYIDSAVLNSDYSIKGNDTTGFTREGYVFVGWNLLSDGSNKSYAKGDIYHVTENLALYAQWEPDTRYVRYEANGGTGGPTTDYPAANSQYTIRTVGGAGISRDGHTFLYWSTNPNGTGVRYDAGDVYTVTANLVLYAQWQAENRFIIYLPNEGQGVPLADTVALGSDYSILGNNVTGFTRDDHTFVGWNTLPNGSGQAYSAGDIYTVTDNLILYAQWSPNAPEAYKVTYHSNISNNPWSHEAGTYTMGESHTIITNTSIGLTRPGYRFLGWTLTPDGSGTMYSAGSTHVFNADTDLYAKWLPIS